MTSGKEEKRRDHQQKIPVDETIDLSIIDI
jgi:hypothetical protein